MLRVFWFFVSVFNELAWDVAGDGLVDMAHVVVPVECNATKKFTFPIHRYVVMFFEGFFEVSGVLHALTLNTKIVNDETEHDGAPDVLVQSRSKLTFKIAGLNEARFEELVGQYSGLG